MNSQLECLSGGCAGEGKAGEARREDAAGIFGASASVACARAGGDGACAEVICMAASRGGSAREALGLLCAEAERIGRVVAMRHPAFRGRGRRGWAVVLVLPPDGEGRPWTGRLVARIVPPEPERAKGGAAWPRT